MIINMLNNKALNLKNNKLAINDCASDNFMLSDNHEIVKLNYAKADLCIKNLKKLITKNEY